MLDINEYFNFRYFTSIWVTEGATHQFASYKRTVTIKTGVMFLLKVLSIHVGCGVEMGWSSPS